jgi:hypothetical protein
MDHNILFVQKKLANLAVECRCVLNCVYIFCAPLCIEICSFKINNSVIEGQSWYDVSQFTASTI